MKKIIILILSFIFIFSVSLTSSASSFSLNNNYTFSGDLIEGGILFNDSFFNYRDVSSPYVNVPSTASTSSSFMSDSRGCYYDISITGTGTIVTSPLVFGFIYDFSSYNDIEYPPYLVFTFLGSGTNDWNSFHSISLSYSDNTTSFVPIDWGSRVSYGTTFYIQVEPKKLLYITFGSSTGHRFNTFKPIRFSLITAYNPLSGSFYSVGDYHYSIGGPAYLDYLNYLDLQGSTSDIYNNGYNNGYDSGYSAGVINGESQGYNNGYDSGYYSGYSAGQQSTFADTAFPGLFKSIINYPIEMIKSFLNFEFMGINLFSVVVFILSIGIVAFVIKRFK